MQKKILFSLMGLLGMALICTGSALALEISYSSLGDDVTPAQIVFLGATDTFTFTLPASGNFIISSVTDTTDLDTLGLRGTISGTFTIGAISIVGSIQSAPVSGTGTFSIVDENSVPFIADLTWKSIFTMGTIGGFNTSGEANLSNISYAGSNTDLDDFGSIGATVLSFQFLPAKSLTALTENGAVNFNSFSGSLAPVPVPGALGLMSLGVLVMVGLGLRKNS
jgi:hypothetical protein